MKINQVLTILFVSTGLFIQPCFNALGQNRQVVLRIQFSSSISTSTQVQAATLKFNKDFAFSFAFDDALDDSYTLAFKLLSGGLSPVDKATYPGLFFTNGCGDRVNFKAGVSWYTANTSNVDLHNGQNSYLTYYQAVEMFKTGWDFYNHSYNHESDLPTTNFIWQLQTNSQVFKDKTGIDLRYCVPPGGDTRYVDPAFSIGTIACITSAAATGEVNVTGPVPLPKPVYWRSLVNSDDDDITSLKSKIDNWVAKTGPGNQRWWNEYTHRVAYQKTGASLEFPTFKGYFEYLEQQYGYKGRDNGWFTNSAEVVDYMLVRDKIRISVQTSGALMEIKLDYSQVPLNLRYYDLSLSLGTTKDVESVTLLTPGIITYAKKTGYTLVNIDLPDSQFSGNDDFSVPEISNLLVFPNPTSGLIGIAHSNMKPIDKIRLFRSDGLECTFPPAIIGDGMIQIDLTGNNFTPGSYFITIKRGSDNIEHARFILVK